MNKNEIYFFVQYKSCGSSSRGILSGGVIISLNDLYNEKYVRSLLKYRYGLMYQIGKDCLHDLKSMQLTEFEEIFDNTDKIKYLLGYSEIVSPFRKEITNKYGPDKDKPKSKTTTIYNAGDMFTSTNGVDYIYLGKVECMQMTLYDKVQEIYTGHLYMRKQSNMNDNTIRKFLCNSAFNFQKFNKNFLVTKKKALADKPIIHTEYKLPQKGVIEETVFKNYTYRKEGKLKIEFIVEN